MALARITLSQDNKTVTIASDEIFPPPTQSCLLVNGAKPTAEGYEITTYGFRLVARQLGQTLREADWEASFDHRAEALISLHVTEVKSRKNAENEERISSEAVKRVVYRTGRFRRQRELKQKQVDNLARLLALSHGANFSVPGAGKTTTLLALYEALAGDSKVDRLLVIAPKNAFLAWETECEIAYETGKEPKFARLDPPRENALAQLETNPEIAVVSYQTLPNVLGEVETWARAGKCHIVLDESHRVKGGTRGYFSSVALQLADAAARRDILSGTPMPQAIEDLRPQFDFLWPGQQVLPEDNLRREPSAELLQKVNARVRPLYVRTTKQELDLPPIELVPVRVTLGPVQRELYDLMRSEAHRKASGFNIHDRNYLRALGRHVMRLLEAASNPLLLASGAPIDDDVAPASEAGMRAFDLIREAAKRESGAKLREAKRRAEATARAGRKVLIWTAFTQNVVQLERELAKWGAVSIYGAVDTGSDLDDRTREGKIRRFHTDPDCRIMIANPAACGEGISLHRACHHAIYLDRTFNAAHYIQSVDRIHRLGLPKDTVTRVEILEATGTIDGRVASRMRTKLEAMSKVLNDPGLEALAYDPEDVTEEFPAGLQAEDVEEVLRHLEGNDEDT